MITFPIPLFAAPVTVPSNTNVDLNATGMAVNVIKGGVAGVVEFDFSGVSNVHSLNSKCFLLHRSNGQVDSFYFSVDGAGVDPHEGDHSHGISLTTSMVTDDYAVATAAVIDALSDYAATGVSGIVTVTAATAFTGTLAEDGAAATGLSFLTDQEGVTGSATIEGWTLAPGHVRLVRFAAGITLSATHQPGGSDILTEEGDYGLLAGQDGGFVDLAFYQRADTAP